MLQRVEACDAPQRWERLPFADGVTDSAALRKGLFCSAARFLCSCERGEVALEIVRVETSPVEEGVVGQDHRALLRGHRGRRGEAPFDLRACPGQHVAR